jgi:hypothetical protein
MKIARYWAFAQTTTKNRKGVHFEIIKWGWSDRNVSDAEHMAQRGVEELAARIASGEGFPDRHAYGYGDGRPLREEVVRTIGPTGGNDEAVITRNQYGALVLNTARIMFVDVDSPGVNHRESPSRRTNRSGGLGGYIGKLFGTRSPSPAMSPDGKPQLTEDEQAAIERARAWTERNRSWGFRVYRTAAGLRLLTTHDVFDPKDRAVVDVMEALGADPLYMRLCRAQECFRARLTPKPWRIKFYPPQIRYPAVDAHQEIAMRKWIVKYEQACAKAATCQLLTTLGNGNIASPVASIIRLHDDETRTALAGELKLA